MLKSKKWLTSLAVGTALMGAGLAVGIVQTQVAQPVAVQAKTKIKTIKVPKLFWKDGKWHSLTVKVPYGKTVTVKQPRYKGYKDIWGGELTSFSVDKNGEESWGDSPYFFMKVISSKQQKKNAKSKKAVTVKASVRYYTKSKVEEKSVKCTVKGIVGTLVKVKAPKVKGYKSKSKMINIAIMGKKSGVSDRLYHYVKK